MPYNKALGLYSTPVKLLKLAKSAIFIPLTEIFNQSVLTGIYPAKLKYARVIPVYKGEDETLPENVTCLFNWVVRAVKMVSGLVDVEFFRTSSMNKKLVSMFPVLLSKDWTKVIRISRTDTSVTSSVRRPKQYPVFTFSNGTLFARYFLYRFLVFSFFHKIRRTQENDH